MSRPRCQSTPAYSFPFRKSNFSTLSGSASHALTSTKHEKQVKSADLESLALTPHFFDCLTGFGFLGVP